MSLIWLLIILVVIALFWGGYGGPRYYSGGGAVGAWSPLGLLILILLILLLTGNLHAQEIGLVALGVVNPTPVSPTPDRPAASDPGAQFKTRWYASVFAWVVGLLLAIVKALQELVPSLGLSPQLATDLLVAGVVLGAIGGALQTFPTAPDAARVNMERSLHLQRKAAAAVKSRQM